MHRLSRISPAAAALALAVFLSSMFFGADAVRAETPTWKLRTADGDQVDFAETQSRGPVLVSFWALWCKPCLKELPHLDALAGDFAGRLSVLAINVDSSRSVAKVRPYLHSHGLKKLTVPLDTAGDVQRRFQAGGAVPFVVLFDAEGTEVYRHVGYKEGDELELRRHIEKLFAADESGS